MTIRRRRRLSAIDPPPSLHVEQTLLGLLDVPPKPTSDPASIREAQQPHRMQGEATRIGLGECHVGIVSAERLGGGTGPLSTV